MVVASLIATMAFQFAVTPQPQSIWNAGDQSANSQNQKSSIYYVRRAGNYLKNGERFYTINTASFVASLSIIMLLMSGLPLNHRIFVWLLMMTTWIAISFIALSYTLAVIQQTPAENERYMYTMFAIAVFAWICLVSLLLVGAYDTIVGKGAELIVGPLFVKKGRRRREASFRYNCLTTTRRSTV